MSSRRRLPSFALVLLLAAPAAAEPGLTGAAFLQRPLGARSSAMGGAYSAVQGHLDSAQYNPAGLAALKTPTLTSTYLDGLGGTSYGYIGYGHPSRFGTLAAGVLYFNAGAIDLNLSDGTRGRVTAEEDYAFTFSYARRLAAGLSAGATYRHLRLALAQTAKASSQQGDFGLTWDSPVHGLTFGAAYQYLGPDIKFEEAGDPPPKTLRYGAAWKLTNLPVEKFDPGVEVQHFDLTVAADVVETLHEKRSPRAGLELGIEPAFLDRAAVRFGWVFERDVDSFTFGLGIREGRFLLDYAFGNARGFNGLQQLSLSFQF